MKFRTNISPFVQKTLFKKMKRLSRDQVNGMLEPTDFSKNDTPWGTMLSRACWVSCHTPRLVKNEDGKFNTELMRLSSAYDNDGNMINEALSGLNPLTSRTMFTLDKSETYRGPAGITGVSVDTKSFFMNSATINFKVTNPNEFERLEKAFLKHGNIVLLRFGWGTPEYDDLSNTKVDFSTFLEAQYKINDINERSNGNYYSLLGVVSDFGFNINTDGVYECNFTLTSMSRNVLGQSIQVGGVDKLLGEVRNKIDSLDSDNDDTKKALEQFIQSFAKFESVMENLGTVVRTYCEQGVEGKTEVEVPWLPDRKLEYFYRNGAMHISNEPGIDKIGFFETTEDKGERGYVSWGWFEDQILNRFFSFISVQEQENSEFKGDGKFKTSIRSTTWEKDDNGNYKEVENECKSHLYLKTMGLTSVILPGSQTFPLYDPKKGDRNILAYIQEINKRFKNFETEKSKSGSIRRMVFPVSMLKTYFTGITSIEQGLNSFWSAVSSLYGGFWNFQVVADDYDSGRIGMVEMYGSNGFGVDVNKDYYNDFVKEVSNSSENIGSYLEYSDNKTNPNKMFMMPIYSKDSFVKDFSLDVKMSSQMITQAVYGTHTTFKTSGGNLPQGLTNLGVRAMSLVMNDSHVNEMEQEVSADEIMKHIAFPEQIRGVQVGSLYSRDEETTEVDPLSTQSQHYVDFTKVPDIASDTEEKINKVKTSKKSLKKLDIEDKDAVEDYAKKLQKDGSVLFFPFSPEIKEEDRYPIYDKSGEMTSYFRKVHNFLIMNYAGKEVDGTKQGASAFYSHIPMTPVRLSLTLDGIGGLRIGNLFVVDYLPQQYRECTHFMITKIGHDLSTSGWSTKIEAVMQVSMSQLTKKRLSNTDDAIKVSFTPIGESIDKTYVDYVKEQKRKVEDAEFRQKMEKVKTENDAKEQERQQNLKDGKFTDTDGLDPNDKSRAAESTRSSIEFEKTLKEQNVGQFNVVSENDNLSGDKITKQQQETFEASGKVDDGQKLTDKAVTVDELFEEFSEDRKSDLSEPVNIDGSEPQEDTSWWDSLNPFR